MVNLFTFSLLLNNAIFTMQDVCFLVFDPHVFKGAVVVNKVYSIFPPFKTFTLYQRQDKI